MAASKETEATAGAASTTRTSVGANRAKATKSTTKKAVKKAVTSKSAAPRKGALAAGAARASGERAKRRSTPLIQAAAEHAKSVSAPTPVPAAASTSTASTSTASTASTASASAAPARARSSAPSPSDATAKHRPRPVAKAVPSRKAVARSGARTAKSTRVGRSASSRSTGSSRKRAAAVATSEARPTRVLKAVPDDAVLPVELAVPAPATSSRSIAPGVEELLTAGIAAVRVVAEAAGVSPEDVERHLASMLSFIRRRITGDYSVDEFGFDEDFTRHFYLPVLRPLYRSWFRVEVRGIENIPATGGGLVVANHSGTIAMDSLMTQVAVHDEHPAHRHLRMLGADLVFQTPVVGQVARKSGSTLAAHPDAERLLSNGELCGVWPEGFKGVGKPFSERYKLQRFGRGGFVSAALRTGAPIIPCSIVGAEEIYPIIGNMKAVARLFGAPYAPITPTWPLLGPLGLIPLPSKWIIEFGAPVETADLGPGAADDPMLVFDLTDQVRETIQQTLYSLLMQRRSVFF
ncbi:lysophospholipid acyltransferase family protein [Pedococcus sp. KACC 23699]|uniref:Lysophospholipid acyltransferase family protein n=1 Tax=Pedococcus sp. KACC 23699 TaxID=3149228 RepID=A0AAU7JQE8_9MICO